MAGNETENKRSNPENTTGTFRVHKAIGVIGFVLLLMAVGIAILPSVAFHSITVQLFLIMLFAISSIPFLLIYLVTKVDIDDVRINCRNMFSIKKSILWRDITCVDKMSPQGAIIICSQNTTIRLYSYLEQFKYLKTLVHHYYPNAFNTRQTLTAGMPGIKPVYGGTVFMLKRANAVVSVILIIIGIGLSILFAESGIILKYLLIGFFLVSGVYYLFSFIIIRVYVDEEKIAYRNILGVTTEIKWQNIKSVKSRYNETQECLIITDGYRTIRGINIGFVGFELMKKMIKGKYPEAELYKGKQD